MRVSKHRHLFLVRSSAGSCACVPSFSWGRQNRAIHTLIGTKPPHTLTRQLCPAHTRGPTVRRSKRRRVEPLKYWKGEHVILERRRSGIIVSPPLLLWSDFIASGSVAAGISS